MCGINGIYGKNSLTDISLRIQNMNKSIKHRGPDGCGIVDMFAQKCALGHQRLSIIDIDSRSNQPMYSNDHKWVIVYNGEIYNYKELKQICNYDFITSSDTEVLIAGIAEYGVLDFVKKTNGMFAFAAVDCSTKKLYLVRDRMGIKPLYYYFDNSRIIFSSEIKGILSSGLVEARINYDAIDEYFGYRYVREPYTLFEGIYQLEAGSILTIDRDLCISKEKYWSLPSYINLDNSYEETELVSGLQEKLEDAVKYRLISDVPLGTYLSGGVDSSLLTALTAVNTNKELNTYSIGFGGLNEFSYAREVSLKYRTRHHEIVINENDYLDRMEELIGYKDAPLGVPNEIPLAVMSGELKKDITVVLSGEGADELFGGYGKIFRSPFDFENHKKDFNKDFYDYFIGLYEYVPRDIRNKYIRDNSNYRNYFDNNIRTQFERNPNEYNVFHFFHEYHVKGLLQRVDTTTMCASVEARVPFLDHTLIEYSYYNVPYSMKLKWKDSNLLTNVKELYAKDYSETLDIPKYILKKLAKRYIPDDVIYRKKMGFPVPLYEWQRDLQDIARNLLRDSKWFNYSLFEAFICDIMKNQIGNQILWMFINMELFYKLYFNRKWTY